MSILETSFKYKGKKVIIYADLNSRQVWASLPAVTILLFGWERTAVSRRTNVLLTRANFIRPTFIKKRRVILQGPYKGQNFNCISYEPGFRTLIEEAQKRDLRVDRIAYCKFQSAFHELTKRLGTEGIQLPAFPSTPAPPITVPLPSTTPARPLPKAMPPIAKSEPAALIMLANASAPAAQTTPQISVAIPPKQAMIPG